MEKNIFAGLEDLGFDNVNNVDIFGDKSGDNKKQSEETAKKKTDTKEYLYDKEVTCPVCGFNFKVKAVKTSGYRALKKDSDFFTRYSLVNPYYYDVWLCNSCGYAAMKVDFERIKESQKQQVLEKITKKWHGKDYPEEYDINIAIERYKLALLNYVVTEAKASKKSFCCLKIAWMYRLLEDSENELLFLNQALEGLTYAYMNEDFPLNGMDKFSTMYLLGELNRRVGKIEEANQWFSKLITSPSADQKFKDMARDQRDLIKETLSVEEVTNELSDDSEEEEKTKKTGFFSKFFK